MVFFFQRTCYTEDAEISRGKKKSGLGKENQSHITEKGNAVPNHVLPKLRKN